MQLHVRRDRCRHRRCRCYTLRLLLLLDAEEAAAVAANDWGRHDIYQSQRLLDLAAERQRIAETPIAPLDPELPIAETIFKAGPFEHMLLKGARLLVNSVKLSRAHHITVADLVDGVELSGSFDEIQLTEALILKGLEALDANVRRARHHDGGATLVQIGPAMPPTRPTPRLRRLS